MARYCKTRGANPDKPSKMKTPKESKNPHCKYLDSFMDMHSFQRKEAPDTFKIRMGEQYAQWALTHKENTRPREFWHSQGIKMKVVKDWAEKCPAFKELYEYGTEELGDHREDQAEKRIMPERVFFHSIPNYLPEMKELEVWRAKLKNENEADKEPITIHIEKFSSKPKE